LELTMLDGELARLVSRLSNDAPADRRVLDEAGLEHNDMFERR
jgi:hypothetical protein